MYRRNQQAVIEHAIKQDTCEACGHEGILANVQTTYDDGTPTQVRLCANCRTIGTRETDK